MSLRSLNKTNQYQPKKKPINPKTGDPPDENGLKFKRALKSKAMKPKHIVVTQDLQKKEKAIFNTKTYSFKFASFFALKTIEIKRLFFLSL